MRTFKPMDHPSTPLAGLREELSPFGIEHRGSQHA
jgi:hypothetical protein